MTLSFYFYSIVMHKDAIENKSTISKPQINMSMVNNTQEDPFLLQNTNPDARIEI